MQKVDYRTSTVRLKLSVRDKLRAIARKRDIKMMDYLEQAINEKEQRDAGAGA
jgi:predicted transcriptional regulator